MIIFSGLDGAGKSTQIMLLIEWFEANDRRAVCLWARGGYTPGFELLKRGLRYVMKRGLPPPGKSSMRQKQLARPTIARIWLSAAIIDLTFYWGIYLRWQRWRGRVVICDRYLDDTRLDFLWNFPNVAFEQFILWRILEWAVPKPDAAFVLLVPVRESLRRSLAKSEPFPDDQDALTWRLASYMDERTFSVDRYIRLDCCRPSSEIAMTIQRLVSECTNLHGGEGAA